MPWGMILSAVLQIVGWIIGKDKKRTAALQAYHKFVDSMEHLGLASVNLNARDRAQVDRLKARREAHNKKI